jgi:hypothetical protein
MLAFCSFLSIMKRMVSYAVDNIKAKQKPINLPFPDTPLVLRQYNHTCSLLNNPKRIQDSHVRQQEQRQLVRINVGHGSIVHRPHEISAVCQGGGAKGPAIEQRQNKRQLI